MPLRIIQADNYDEIESGDLLVSVNNHAVNDLLDYRYYSADDLLALLIQKSDGSVINLEYDALEYGTPELEFAPDPVKRCKNRCIFCFIHQLPKGLRKSLYVKDEDYRLSFSHGNYITLTNLSEEDFARIIEMHLSPLYISVHATDEKLRRKMLGRENIPELNPQIKRLIESGIELHTQVVLCPGVNDCDHLEKTCHDLSGFYPGLKSLAVVPVGLTSHRANLPGLQKVTPRIAEEILGQIKTLQKGFLKKLGSRFVYPADEFFLLANREIPPRSYYEDFPQIENGVGMVRGLLSSRKLPEIRLKRKIRALIPTGKLIAETLDSVLSQKLEKVKNLKYDIIPVENKLMGKTVTVSGLLGGKDIYSGLKKAAIPGDVVFLPPDCLNDDGLFLDDWTPGDIEKKLKMPVVSGCYSIYNTFMPILRRYC